MSSEDVQIVDAPAEAFPCASCVYFMFTDQDALVDPAPCAFDEGSLSCRRCILKKRACREVRVQRSRSSNVPDTVSNIP